MRLKSPIASRGYRLVVAGNGFCGSLDTECAGIVVTLFSMSHLSMRFSGIEPFARRFHQLRDFACDHPDGDLILSWPQLTNDWEATRWPPVFFIVDDFRRGRAVMQPMIGVVGATYRSSRARDLGLGAVGGRGKDLLAIRFADDLGDTPRSSVPGAVLIRDAKSHSGVRASAST
jgi:hypothetical protein